MQQSYERPAIEDLGTLADITLGANGQFTDLGDLGSIGVGGSIITVPTTPALPPLP